MLYVFLVLVVVVVVGLVWIARYMDNNDHVPPTRIYLEDAIDGPARTGEWHDNTFIPALELAKSNKGMVIVELGCLSKNIDELLFNELYYTAQWQTKININFYHEHNVDVQNRAYEVLELSKDKL